MSASGHSSERTVVARTVHPLFSSGLSSGPQPLPPSDTLTRLGMGPSSLDGLDGSGGGAARLCHAMITNRMIPPWAWRAPSPSRAPARILRDGGCGIRLTGKPPGLHLFDVRYDGFGFLGLRSGLGPVFAAVPVGSNAPRQSVVPLGRPVLCYTPPRPGGAHCGHASGAAPRPSSVQVSPLREVDTGWLLSPGFEFLPDRTGPRD